MNNKALFTNIRSEILSLLETATEEILIAMAWFTNRQLLESLIQCAKRGVTVKLVLLDDIINHCDFGTDFNLFIKEKRCELYLYPPSRKLMHNKFCVIDRKIVITGSYNWTNYAETRNLENIAIISESLLVNDYAHSFNDLAKGLHQADSFEILTQKQISDSVFISRLSDFAQEVFSCSAPNSSTYSDAFKEKIESTHIDLPADLESFINKRKYYPSVAHTEELESCSANKNTSQLTKVENFKYAVSKYNIGFKANLINQGGKEGLKVMIAKGQALPFTVTQDAKSANSGEVNTMISKCELFFGDSTDLSLCSKLGETLTLNDLPQMREGEVLFKIMMTLEESGLLYVRFVCINTGSGVESRQIDKDYVEYQKS